MYLQHFGLSDTPFSIAPNPRFLFLSQRHQEALAHLLYGIHGSGGFVLLTGAVGAGKTTVCRCLLEQIPAHCDVAYIFNPKLSVVELLATICSEFGIVYPADNSSIKVFVDLINTHLLATHARGRQSVLIIDEAQNLAPDVLEQLRLLTNLETDQRKLLQIILIGQPELATLLERPGLRQLAQRIIARYHLEPLSKTEITAYVQHRLAVSGTQRQLIPPALSNLLYRLSGGVPRLINVLCDRALLGAYTQGQDKVDRATLLQAGREVLPPRTPHTPRLTSLIHPWQTIAAITGALLAGCLITYAYLHTRDQATPTTFATPATTAPPAAHPPNKTAPSAIPAPHPQAHPQAHTRGQPNRHKPAATSTPTPPQQLPPGN
jgi:general secretion pathway protein A